MSSHTTAWDIYAEQLLPLGHGHPLWFPEPVEREVQVGDVGWLEEGGFAALFNSMKSERHPINATRGVPRDFVQFNPPNLWISDRQQIAQPVLCSRSIRTLDAQVDVTAGSSALPVAFGAGFKFQSDSDSGAMAMLKPPAKSSNIMSKRHIVNYMRDNFDSWLEFANGDSHWGLDLKEQDIIFISGTVKTTHWAVVAFNGNYRKKQGYITGGLSSMGTTGFSVQISDHVLPSEHYRHGPSLQSPAPQAGPSIRAPNYPGDSTSGAGPSKPDQCLFVHYFKMKRRLWWPPREPMLAAAGPHQLAPGPEPDDPNSHAPIVDPSRSPPYEFEPEDAPGRADTYDPVNYLLDYILLQSNAEYAIASDLDLIALSSGFAIDEEFPTNVWVALLRVSPLVEVDKRGVGTVHVDDPLTAHREKIENMHGKNAYWGLVPQGQKKFEPSRELVPSQGCRSEWREASNITGSSHFEYAFSDKIILSHNGDSGTSDEDVEISVEISPDEMPDYFRERDGRLFHSHGRSPYPLPVDAEEQQRQSGLNQLLRRFIGDSFVGPVRDLLAYAPGECKRVLDLGTGTGQWVLDMARDFPHVRFYGVDIVPIATRYPPSNVNFEMHDIMEPFRYEANSINLVHARSITMAIRASKYETLLPEIARVLRPGGLFVSCEWGHYPLMNDGSDISRSAPHSLSFYHAVREHLHMQFGIHEVGIRIPDLLRQSGLFTDIVAHSYTIPIGDWHSNPTLKELGQEYRKMVELYARSLRAVLMDGPFADRADELVSKHISEIWSVPGMVSTYRTVHARRL